MKEMALLTICDEHKVERKFFIRQLEEGYSVYLHSLSCMKNSHEWRRKFPRVAEKIPTGESNHRHEWRERFPRVVHNRSSRALQILVIARRSRGDPERGELGLSLIWIASLGSQRYSSSRGEAVAIQIEGSRFDFNLDCFTSFAMTV